MVIVKRIDLRKKTRYLFDFYSISRRRHTMFNGRKTNLTLIVIEYFYDNTKRT